jgi:hypothetical protein
MGWDFTRNATRADIIAERTKGWENGGTKAVCLAHHLSLEEAESVLWTVWEHTKDGWRFIGCDLLRPKPNFGWGYKDMCESSGPYYWSCPIEYLEMAPEANPGWRKIVREKHLDYKKMRQLQEKP